MLFNLASVVDWWFVTATKQLKVDIDNVREKSKRVTHDYAIGNQFYVEMKGIYHQLDYKKQGPYIITEVFRNGTVKFQQGQVYERMHIRLIKPHFD